MAPRKSLGESDFSVEVVTFLKYSPAIFVFAAGAPVAAGAAGRPCPAEALFIHPAPAIHRTVAAAVATTADFEKSFMTQAFYSIFAWERESARLPSTPIVYRSVAFSTYSCKPAKPNMAKSVII
jgi:hypothetical protein